MDGREKQLNASLRRRLAHALAIAIVAVGVAAGVFSFFSAFHDAHELQDDLLTQVAELVSARGVLLPPLRVPARLEDADHDSTLIVRRLEPADAAVSALDTTAGATGAAAKVPNFPAGLAPGLHTVRVAGTRYRVRIGLTREGHQFAVAQEAGVRDEAAAMGALRTLLPLAILVPLLLFIVARLVRELLRPMAEAARRVNARPADDLRPIAAGTMPTEVRPFLDAINGLLARVAAGRDAQRRFVADAAHELRSPLTALSLQAERLEQADMSPAARARVEKLRGGIARNRELLNQLLTLSRMQAGPAAPTEPVALRAVFRDVAEEMMPLAHAKHIDLGVIEGVDVAVRASALDLRTLVKNLVDNAIRYTPEGGRVDLSLTAQAGGVVLRVADTGPGIPPEERTRVFEPFYRILGNEQTGSGLGLPIVQTIAERLDARIELAETDAERRTGLTVAVFFPSAPGTPPRP